MFLFLVAMFLFLILTWKSPVSSAVFILHLSFSTPHCLLYTIMFPCFFLLFEPWNLGISSYVFLWHLSFSPPHCLLFTLLLLCSFLLFGVRVYCFLLCFPIGFFFFYPLLSLVYSYVSMLLPLIWTWETPVSSSVLLLDFYFSTPYCLLYTLLLPCSFLLFEPGSLRYPPLFSYCISLFLPVIVSCLVICCHVPFFY
jgi:hypothetical protein